MKDFKVEIIHAVLLSEDNKYRLKEAFDILLSKRKNSLYQSLENSSNPDVKTMPGRLKHNKSKKT